ncbi:MAG: hypothetical protein JXA10_18730 [Anaerolineae bacterium]|nr:hypothetical protein [Anaerolineae bacterium]
MKRNFGSYEFEHICTIQPARDDADNILLFRPQADYAKKDERKLHAYGNGAFCRFRIPKDLHLEGVYIITANAEATYIGECIDLAQRYNMGYGQISPRNCYTGGQPTNCRINKLIFTMVQKGQQVDLWFYATSNRKHIESELIKSLDMLSRWNQKG